MTMEQCSICETSLDESADVCATCGAPTDDRAATGDREECPHCGSVIWSHAEKCPSCAARGYPALRPRMGDKSLLLPEDEDGDG